MLLLLSTCLCLLLVSCNGTNQGNCSNSNTDDTDCCLNYRLVNNICHPCPDGWYEKNCSTPCPEGHFGLFCSKGCPSDCIETCHHVNGSCSDERSREHTKDGDDVTVQNNSDAKNRSSSLLELFRSPHVWIIGGCVIGIIVIICVVVAGIRGCYRIKVNSWKPTLTVYNDENHSNRDEQFSTRCCEPNTSKSSLRLPCKDCAMNPNGKVIVSDLPVYSPIPEEDAPDQTYSSITNEETVHDSNYKYASPSITRRFTSFKSNTGVKRSDKNPLNIDEKYMMVRTGSKDHTSEICDTGYSANGTDESNAYFILEKTHPENDDRYPSSGLINIENLPPPRFSVLGNDM